MTEYLLGSVDEFAEGKGRAFKVGTRLVAVFRVGQSFHAVANRCVHKGANMCDGEVTPDGTKVRCPWHNWPFDLATGRNTIDPEERLRTYEVELDGNDVILRV